MNEDGTKLPAVRDVETPKLSAKLEQALVDGDLKGLSTGERVEFYNATCQSLGLNPLTKPFGYIVLNGKLTLYALKACTDQLRETRRVSITALREEPAGDIWQVWADAKDASGRTDADLGAVSIKGLAGEALCNAKMKAVTKAKRRVTLSICGLGMLDETEVITIPGARMVGADDPVAPPIARPRRLEKGTTDANGREQLGADVGAGAAPARGGGSARVEPDPPLPTDRRSGGESPQAVVRLLTPEENAKLDRELAAEEGPPGLFGEDVASEMRATGAENPGKPGAFASRDQVVRLFALCHEHKVSEEALSTHLLNQYGVQSRSKIPRVLYDAIVQWVTRPAEKTHARITYRRPPARR